MQKRKQVKQTDLTEQIAMRVAKLLMPAIKKTIFEQNKKLAVHTRKVVKEEIKNMAYDLMLEQRKSVNIDARGNNTQNYDDETDFLDEKPQKNNLREASGRGRQRAKQMLDDNFLSERDQAAQSFEFDDGEYMGAESTEALIETAGGNQYNAHQQNHNPAELLSSNVRDAPVVSWEQIADDELTTEQQEMATDPSAIDYSGMMDMMDETLVDTSKKWGVDKGGQSTQINPDIIKQEYEKQA